MPYSRQSTPPGCSGSALQALADHLVLLAQEAGHAGERRSGEEIIELLYALLDQASSTPAQAEVLQLAS